MEIIGVVVGVWGCVWGGGWGWFTSYNGLYGEAPPKRGGVYLFLALGI